MLEVNPPQLKCQLVQIMHRMKKKITTWHPVIQKYCMNGIICLWAVRLWELQYKSILGCIRLTGSLSRISARWRGFFEKSSIIRVAAAAAKKKKDLTLLISFKSSDKESIKWRQPGFLLAAAPSTHPGWLAGAAELWCGQTHHVWEGTSLLKAKCE